MPIVDGTYQLELPEMPSTTRWVMRNDGSVWEAARGAPPTRPKWRRCSWCQKDRAMERQEFCRTCLSVAGTGLQWGRLHTDQRLAAVAGVDEHRMKTVPRVEEPHGPLGGSTPPPGTTEPAAGGGRP